MVAKMAKAIPHTNLPSFQKTFNQFVHSNHHWRINGEALGPIRSNFIEFHAVFGAKQPK